MHGSARTWRARGMACYRSTCPAPSVCGVDGDAGTLRMCGRVPDRHTGDGAIGARSVTAGPLVALIALVAALVATHLADVPLRDPDGVAGRRLVVVMALALGLVALDVVVRASRRSGTRKPSRAAMRAVLRQRWGWYRSLAVGGALVSFYVTYLAYRNIKSVVPLLRPGHLFDHELAELDRVLFAGHDPFALLHSLLGSGLQTHLLSLVYLFFIVFVPLSLACALVFSRNLRGGLFFTTALSINWSLGAAGYVLLPALGPVYATPAAFAHLPGSHASNLQDFLLDERVAFLAGPQVDGTAQAIAAFPSLHISILFTVAVAAHLLGLTRNVRIALWALVVASTASTIYLGWHYVVDGIAGVAIGLAALAVARLLTGFTAHTTARRRPAPSHASTRARPDHAAHQAPVTHGDREDPTASRTQ